MLNIRIFNLKFTYPKAMSLIYDADIKCIAFGFFIMEIWKDINGFDGDYQISNYGRIKSLKGKNELIRKINISNKGYLILNLLKNGKDVPKTIHRLLAEHFIPNANNLPCVNHKDGDKLNNSLDNLEWCTYSENNKHSFDKGLKIPTRGEKTHTNKLKSSQVIEIDKLLKNGVKVSHIACTYNISKRLIYGIKNRTRWKHLFE